MTAPIGLTAYAAELKYAAGPGAAKLSTSVVAGGTIQSKTGIGGVDIPGPALQSVLAGRQKRARRGVNDIDPARVPVVANSMARSAADKGADLLRGEKR